MNKCIPECFLGTGSGWTALRLHEDLVRTDPTDTSQGHLATPVPAS